MVCSLPGHSRAPPQILYLLRVAYEYVVQIVMLVGIGHSQRASSDAKPGREKRSSGFNLRVPELSLFVDEINTSQPRRTVLKRFGTDTKNVRENGPDESDCQEGWR